MRTNTFFIGTLCAVSFGSLHGALQADASDAQMRNLDHRVTALEQKKQANSMVNPSGRPQVRDGADLFITAEWLIWQAHEDGLNYAVKHDSALPDASDLYDSSLKNPHFDWDSGLRVGLGYNLPHDGWDFAASWTWFQNKAKGSSAPKTPNDLLSTQAFEPGTSGVDSYLSASSRLRLHINLIDLELGREFFVSKWMTLRPFIGIRNGWVRQNQSITYNTPDPAAISGESGYFLKNTCNYWGIGPRAGLNTQWGLGYGVSFFGNGSVSLLNGVSHTEGYQTQQFPDGTRNDTVSADQSYHIGRFIANLAIGLGWDKMLANDSCHIGLRAGWEQMIFFGMNQFVNFFGSSQPGNNFANQGDLTTQGWTISGRFDF